jgi:hypothetical protein
MQTLDIAGYEYGRQDVLVAKATITTGTGNDIVAQGTVKCIAIPAGAIVLGGYVNVTDATSADVDGAATGLTALVPTGYKYTADDTIDIMIDTADPAADGEIELVVMYMVDGRSAFVQK